MVNKLNCRLKMHTAELKLRNSEPGNDIDMGRTSSLKQKRVSYVCASLFLSCCRERSDDNMSRSMSYSL